MDIYDDPYQRYKKLSIYWHNKASDLWGSAGALWACMKNERSREIAKELNMGEGFSIAVAGYPVYKMLCGMALELIYKSIVVAKGGEPNTKSHNLDILAREAGIQPNKNQIGLLNILSESIYWEGRYPVPKNPENMERLIELSHEYLCSKERLGKIHVLKPNNALSWESFNLLWNEASQIYWEYHS